jgi:nicotinamide mononucleotide (NMN) deamidase PncC
MDAAVRSLIARLHNGPHQYVLVVSGGGSGIASWLLSVPGGSRAVLEVVVPYSEDALCDYLGHCPESFCSAETTCLMAQRALERARWLAPGRAVAGIACTASLRSDRPKRGDHRFHLAIQTIRQTWTYSLTFTKEARDREGEETVLDLALLNAMAEAFGIPDRVSVPLLAGEEIIAGKQPSPDALAALLAGRIPALCFERDGRMRCDAPRPLVLLSGSFNPLHAGHLGLMEVACCLLRKPAAFELAVVNADKGSLADEEVRRRAAQFTWQAPLWLTRAPSFEEKAVLFPGATFIVGMDTAARIVQTRFYGDRESRMSEAMDLLRSRDCRFLVAGRLNAGGMFIGLEELEIPASHRDLFTAIPTSAFRMDLSSTQLRGGTKN